MNYAVDIKQTVATYFECQWSVNLLKNDIPQSYRFLHDGGNTSDGGEKKPCHNIPSASFLAKRVTAAALLVPRSKYSHLFAANTSFSPLHTKKCS